MLILSLISIQCWEFNTKVAIQGIGTIADKILCSPHTIEKTQNLYLYVVSPAVEVGKEQNTNSLDLNQSKILSIIGLFIHHTQKYSELMNLTK